MDFQPILDFFAEYGFEMLIGAVLIICNIFGIKIKKKKPAEMTTEQKEKQKARLAKRAQKYANKAKSAMQDIENLKEEE